MKRLLLTGVSALLVGCASVGTNVDMNAVNALQIGMSEAEVTARLGQPNSFTRLADGSRQLGWI